jgi:hypothetical protein
MIRHSIVRLVVARPERMASESITGKEPGGVPWEMMHEFDAWPIKDSIEREIHDRLPSPSPE